MWLISLNTHVHVPQCLIIMSVCILPAKHSKSYHVISKSYIYISLYNSFLLMYAISLGFKYHRPGWYHYLTNWTLSIFFLPHMVLWQILAHRTVSVTHFFSDSSDIHFLIHCWSSHIYKRDIDPKICDRH